MPGYNLRGAASGHADLAESLAHERLALKPHCPINRGFLSPARQREMAVT